MKKKLLIGVMTLSVFLTVGCGCNKKDVDTPNNNNNNEENGGSVAADTPTYDNPAVITNEEIIKDQSVESLQFTQTSLIYNGNMSVLTSQVTNVSDQPVELTNVVATVSYVDVYEMERTLEMSVYFGERLEAGETRSTENYVDVDLRKATNIEYRIVRE